MNVKLTDIAEQMFDDLRTQMEATSAFQDDKLPALAEVELPGDITMSIHDVADIIQIVLDQFSDMNVWYLSYTCEMCLERNTFKLVVRRSSIYGQ